MDGVESNQRAGGWEDSLTSEEQDTVDRNVEHLQLMVAKDYWTTEDLTPFNNAITAFYCR